MRQLVHPVLADRADGLRIRPLKVGRLSNTHKARSFA